ncbi:type I secretion system permease/ATPase [Marichromatium gracile]|uniref:Peptidase n=1 Tax=Marichromatium gracile TaxID=1048 RepID=A0ABR5VF38_MARGR|nr:type I secretion system permease/ATPase [Marichromatium gracile]KXX64341.1 peptidase [Marichromatium gracile]
MAELQPAKTLKEAMAICRSSFYGAGFFSLFINLLMLVPPLYMLQIYDRVLASSSVSTLMALTVLVAFLMLTMGLLEWVRSLVLIRVGARLDGVLSQRVFDATMDVAARQPGQGSAQPISDLGGFRQFMTGNGLFGFFDAPWIPVYMVVIFMFHPLLGVIALGGALILIALAFLNEFRTRKPLMAASNQAIREQHVLNAKLRNVEVIEALGMRPQIQQRWHDHHADTIGWQARASEEAALLMATSKSFRMFLQSLILGAGAWLAIQQSITPGVMIAASIMMGRALAPVDQMIGSWKGFVNARASYGRLQKLLTEIPPGSRHISLPAPTGALQLEGVVAAPPGARKPVLRGISLEIAAGDVVGMIGPSAAGKSTLARVMLGIWPLASGAVRLDGADLALYNRDELGPHIGYLPQDVELFDGTVAENIARFGEIEDAEVVAAAQRAGVHELIGQLPNGYDTRLGGGGVMLSGGQRQRIGLARALYKNPKLVILDEPNSNLDDRGEAALLEAIDNLRATHATVVLISHRPSVLKAVDKVLVIKDGRVEAYGPRQEVLSRVLKPRSVQPASLDAASSASA